MNPDTKRQRPNALPFPPNHPGHDAACPAAEPNARILTPWRPNPITEAEMQPPSLAAANRAF